MMTLPDVFDRPVAPVPPVNPQVQRDPNWRWPWQLNQAHYRQSEANTNRAEWAAEAMDVFEAATGVDPEGALCDLLCDLMHLARTRGRDHFRDELDRALLHFEADANGED